MHAEVAWNLGKKHALEVALTKVDVSLDLAGSFLPNNVSDAYEKIKTRLNRVLSAIFDKPGGNMISTCRLAGLQASSGSNTIDSCFQYRVLDDDRSQLLVIKFYDKVMDLVGRDGSQ